MTRKIEQGRLIVASHNQGKVVEIGDLLRDFKVGPVLVPARLGSPSLMKRKIALSAMHN